MSLYIDLLKNCLVGWPYQVEEQELTGLDVNRQNRIEGWDDWNLPFMFHTMIGLKRLSNIEDCIESVLKDNIPGSLVECGVWRGGATVLMRGVLKEHEITDRNVWVVDSFQGVPESDLEQDQSINYLHLSEKLKVPLERVKSTFSVYGLLDDQVRFLEGWFSDTLPGPIEDVAVLRLDGDLYKSTMETLNGLYSHVSLGGYIIIDDYFCIVPCQQAVDDFRMAHNIKDELWQIDQSAGFWRKGR